MFYGCGRSENYTDLQMPGRIDSQFIVMGCQTSHFSKFTFSELYL